MDKGKDTAFTTETSADDVYQEGWPTSSSTNSHFVEVVRVESNSLKAKLLDASSLTQLNRSRIHRTIVFATVTWFDLAAFHSLSFKSVGLG